MTTTEVISGSTEITSRSLRKLEIGTANGGGALPTFPGYDPRVFESGTEITTIDLPFRFRDPRLHIPWSTTLDDVIDTNDLKDTYDIDSIWFMNSVDEMPTFAHNVVIGDGRELPFADDTFGQTLMFNVIGDPSVDVDSVKRLVHEALRVSDELMVVEDRTPDIAAERFARIDFDAVGITVKDLMLDDRGANHAEYLARKAVIHSKLHPWIYVLAKNDVWHAQTRQARKPVEQAIPQRLLKNGLGGLAVFAALRKR